MCKDLRLAGLLLQEPQEAKRAGVWRVLKAEAES